MRVWGRVLNADGTKSWVPVVTDPRGNNDWVYVTALIQCLKLNRGESPFYANFGIPARQSVESQIAPDYYVALTQQQYAQFFASLVITRVDVPPKTLKEEPIPTYRINILTHSGVSVALNIPV